MQSINILRALSDSGLQVPRDVSVLGFDDWDAASRCEPPLTTIHNSLGQMGAMAVEELLRLLDQGQASSLTRIPTRLVVRSSVALRYGPEGRQAE